MENCQGQELFKNVLQEDASRRLEPVGKKKKSPNRIKENKKNTIVNLLVNEMMTVDEVCSYFDLSQSAVKKWWRNYQIEKIDQDSLPPQAEVSPFPPVCPPSDGSEESVRACCQCDYCEECEESDECESCEECEDCQDGDDDSQDSEPEEMPPLPPIPSNDCEYCKEYKRIIKSYSFICDSLVSMLSR